MKHFRKASLTFLVLFLAACSKNSTNQASPENVTQESSRSEKKEAKSHRIEKKKEPLLDLSCEETLRKRITEKGFRFSSFKGLETYAMEANKKIPLTGNDLFGYTKSDEINQSVFLESSVKVDQEKTTLTTNLYKLDENGENFLVKMSAHKTGDVGSEVLEQLFYADKNCDIKSGTMSLNITERTASLSVRLKKIIAEENLEPKEFLKTIDRPTSDPMIALLNVENIQDIPALSYAYIEDVGLIELRFRKSFYRNKVIHNEKYRVYDLMLKVGDSNYIRGEVGENKDSFVRYLNLLGETKITITKEEWDQIKIYKNEDLLKIKGKLPSNYFQNNNRIIFSSNSENEYEGLYDYWTTDDSFSDGPKVIKILKKATTAKIYRQEEESDMETNEVFNTENLEIQLIKREILSKNPKNNTEKAQYILDYISKNFTYDFDLTKSKESTYRFTVDELLERKKGICTHYSILFVTLARALGIPSRVVAGFDLSSGEAEGHAWVEFETKPSVWAAIDPQLKRVDDSVLLKPYFPVTNYKNLRKKDSSQTELISFFLSSAKFQPYSRENLENELASILEIHPTIAKKKEKK